MNNVHSVALSPLTKVLLDRNHGILDLISSHGGVSQLHRENITEGLYDLVKENTSSYNITISKSKHHSKRCMQAERAMHIPFIKIPILTKETRTQDLNVRKIETWFVICTIMVYCLLIRRDTSGGQTARQAGTGLGIGPGILTVIMNGDPPPI